MLLWRLRQSAIRIYAQTYAAGGTQSQSMTTKPVDDEGPRIGAFTASDLCLRQHCCGAWGVCAMFA